MVVAHDVRGNNGILDVLKNTLQGAFSSSLHSSINLFNGNFLLELYREVNHGPIRCRNARCKTIELALELRENQGNRASSTGSGGNHGQVCSTSTTKVLVSLVENLLIIRV